MSLARNLGGAGPHPHMIRLQTWTSETRDSNSIPLQAKRPDETVKQHLLQLDTICFNHGRGVRQFR